MSLDGKIALVTGATRGIGKAIAISLGEQGATVIGTATSENGAATISDFLKEANIQGRGIVLNVTDADAIDNVVSTIESEFGAPEILVNNAGITRDNLLMRMKDDEWDDIINTNLTPIYKLSKRCLRAMTKARWGRIITITSVVGAMGNAGQTNYAAAKAGVIGFSKSLAREVGARGITVNTVAPGFIDTDMTSSLPEAHKTALLEQVPLKRLGLPEEIAAAVSYLASTHAGYVTGETLHVNGGMYMS
ncbi:MAG: 3-oxoacyl-ACP reductase [Methylophaga sp.]|jgi:3-oxoacyl-[acyl-carrier protein] reductase|uniref:3-oxoacyl-ACP reductase FabG n=1 Tax=Methylophaga sp. UBA678 TaxID=1946901 RepID=UPI000C67B974|nr:3-oxoacyl-ACP reductase FabG [Methylophaga sp. UBA678]MAX50534.1 3-oxoacyl-ACP reductase [Methylophaga sp.]|tara:strand:+ start:2823 stop:3566 length:744 start_codon:yes stop_codon:yes gene_type:complete